jgi:hypothetical protein
VSSGAPRAHSASGSCEPLLSGDEKVANHDICKGLARRDRKGNVPTCTMDKSKTPPSHLELCRYPTLCRGFWICPSCTNFGGPQGGPMHPLAEVPHWGPPILVHPWGHTVRPSPGSPGGWLWQVVKPRVGTDRAQPKLGSRTLPPRRALSGLPRAWPAAVPMRAPVVCRCL